jgi:hypothetical protein
VRGPQGAVPGTPRFSLPASKINRFQLHQCCARTGESRVIGAVQAQAVLAFSTLAKMMGRDKKTETGGHVLSAATWLTYRWNLSVPLSLPRVAITQPTLTRFSIKQNFSNLTGNSYVIQNTFKGKGKVHLRTGHKPPGVGVEYSFSNLGVRLGWVVNATPRPLYPRERPGTLCIGGWVGPRAGLDGCGKSRPHRYSIPNPKTRLL